jgi:hypothetical protein
MPKYINCTHASQEKLRRFSRIFKAEFGASLPLDGGRRHG